MKCCVRTSLFFFSQRYIEILLRSFVELSLTNESFILCFSINWWNTFTQEENLLHILRMLRTCVISLLYFVVTYLGLHERLFVCKWKSPNHDTIIRILIKYKKTKIRIVIMQIKEKNTKIRRKERRNRKINWRK